MNRRPCALRVPRSTVNCSTLSKTIQVPWFGKYIVASWISASTAHENAQEKMGVANTPALFFNGVRQPGWPDQRQPGSHGVQALDRVQQLASHHNNLLTEYLRPRVCTPPSLGRFYGWNGLQKQAPVFFNHALHVIDRRAFLPSTIVYDVHGSSRHLSPVRCAQFLGLRNPKQCDP